MFGYNGKIYITKDGRVFEIRKRANSAANDWSELYSKFFGSGNPNSTSAANSAGASVSKSDVWTTYQEAADAGYSNIMTRTEWARRKSSSGYSTYADYLAGMYAKYMG